MRTPFLPLVLSILLVLLLSSGCSDDGPVNAVGEEIELTTAEATRCARRANNTADKLLECVSLEGVRAHQAALQAVADANGGIRTSGTPGYNASVEYVKSKLQAAGYVVTLQSFDFQAFIELSPTLLEQVSPPPLGPVENRIMSYSGSGDVTADVSTLTVITGCNAADFAGFTPGHIALIQRGTCTFALKATNAYNAGAVGVIIYNNIPGVIHGTLGSDFTLDIPVTSVSQSVGQQLATTLGLSMRLKTETHRGLATTANVIAETPGDANNVVVVGAHLDSVNDGPGIQDNGSGSAALLETALQMARVRPTNKVRFAWWAAYEAGVVGSHYYVDNLTSEQLDKIALYLNFDIIGSPNYVFFVYDGDDSDGVGTGPGPDGSAAIEAVFESYYDGVGEPYKGFDLPVSRSDIGPFMSAGIPIGGLFTGAEVIKTAEEESIWGGTAGDQYDPCYHLACDTFDNINLHALEVNADAVAYATLHFALSTEAVNGVRGRGRGKGKSPFAPTFASGEVTQ